MPCLIPPPQARAAALSRGPTTLRNSLPLQTQAKPTGSCQHATSSLICAQLKEGKGREGKGNNNNNKGERPRQKRAKNRTRGEGPAATCRTTPAYACVRVRANGRKQRSNLQRVRLSAPSSEGHSGASPGPRA